ncbi:flavodoxin-dependent (E)-4-hydroxy-3-methylbut-2-enyl-diphosphate synthase [bacterium]|nr:flavodoxin-dependent (E)-4-hydroxy-3-methylbut-2-enyl-diphosphate synthase [bacterium]
MKRRKTRQVSIGKVKIGGGAVVSIQSMTKTDTRDVKATVKQIKELEKEGCEIIRVAIPDREAAKVIPKIKKRIKIPLVADIHFDYRLALEAMENGADGIRINPGNIKDKEKIIQIVRKAREKEIPIRIGVNSGSLNRKKYKGPLARAMVRSALDSIKIFEKEKFYNIIVSLKASDVLTTTEAYRLMAKRCNYPFHLGITATGLPPSGIIKSAIGIGSLLLEGIGDTIRVSLTGPPQEEVRVGYEILRVLGLRKGMEIIACPTCGRCEIDLIKIAQEVEKKVYGERFTVNGKRPLKVAIMGCVVNGPGEAREADIGMAGGKKTGVIFRKGRVIKKAREKDLVKALLRETKKIQATSHKLQN